jgi:RHS repeat-associated protein
VKDPRLEDKSRRNASADDTTSVPRPQATAPLNATSQDSLYHQDDINIPKVELPKGGGALKSIDEKFQVNPANGTVSFSVPLPHSRARADLAPALSLGYNSGSGNGVFGLGWSLTHTSIQRRTDKRLPEYQDSIESDVFLLSGGEDLVPALVEDEAGNWTPDEFVAPTGEAVKRYRPRIEGTFARIERITPPGEASFFWKITSKDNVVTIYGSSAGARLGDPSAPTRVFKWLPEISYDDKGNCLEYSYVPEDFQNVPNTLHEKNRLNGLAPCANTYLKRVKYGNKNPYYADPEQPFTPQVPVNPAYFFELVFDYGDHDTDAPAPAVLRPWPCRLDPFSEYKPGFEVRTYRLCRRALLFHYFKELNDGVNPAPCLVRSLDLDYRYFANPAATPSDLRNLEVDYPIAIRQTGWVKNGPASYDTRSLPPAQLTYQELNWNKTVQTVSAENLENAPIGLSRVYQFVDLWSEGISGILTEQGGSWFYKHNLGSGQFTAAQVVAPKPSVTGLTKGTVQLQDLEADGRKFMVVTEPPVRGAFELSDDGDWQPFASFQNVPNVVLNDPDTKFIDLDGDGRLDLAVSEENVFIWYPSAGIDGYEAPRTAPKPFDEESGPALVFSDPTGSIFLAGMSGSGLTDIVRVRNGEICYWPNLGYGRFGPKVSMDFSPVFDTPDLFNPAYIHLADVSGTGASDILYLGQNKMRAWLNQSGNAWSEEADIEPFPTTELPSQLSVADFLGNGTACVVWSSPLPRYSASPMQYVDLMGGKKPYLLTGYQNQSGKEVTLEYKSSTYFYLADKQGGKPWITKLPFPVQCLTKVRSRDAVTRAYLTTEYVYHHGYYDHAEREYRGFGFVEQIDTETFDEFVKSGASNIVNQPLHQAPVLTKTWFHTGAYFGEDDILARLRTEFFQNTDLAEYHLPTPQVRIQDQLSAPHVPPPLSAQEMREAQRACKGLAIRQEVYGLDNIDGVSTIPYSTSERNWLIQRVQPLSTNRYAVFLVNESESLTYTYERNSKDPRIAHRLNTALDIYGNTLESATVAYPRQPDIPGLPARVQAEQQQLKITYALTGYTNDWIAPAAYRLRLRCETASFELTGAAPAASYFTLDEMRTAFAGAAPIKYEDQPDGSSQKRLLKHSRTLFLKYDLSGPLGLGQMQSLGMPYETYRLTFTATLLAARYGARVTPAFLTEGAYIYSDDFKASGLFPPSDANDEWWVHAGHATYPAGAASFFYMPNGFLDPFGNVTSIAYYADYQLVVQAVTDAAGNATSVEAFNFRNLQPQLVKDANANLSEVRFDALGFVVGTALQGKGSEADDFTGFVTDLAPADVANFFSDPVTIGPNLLQHATGRFVYDFSAIPIRVAEIVRETHFQDTLASGSPSKLQYRFEYSDGFGNVAMRKVQAKPGLALELDGANNLILVDTTPNLRWIGNGRTVRNNKGNPVKQFEPYFSTTYNYEDDPQLVEIGVTPLLYYDPLGRNVRTDYPNGTFSRTDIQGWLVRTFDQNDTVLDSDWYTQRTSGSLAANPQENQAAQKAAIHYNTPAVTHADGLGRAFYGVSHNKFVDHTTLTLTELFYETYTGLDIEGYTKQIVDPRGNVVVSCDYDMLGNQAHGLNMDAGERWLLNDCTGHALYTFDSKNQVFHTLYDALRRPVQATVARQPALPIVFDRITYGEGRPGDQAQNLRGRIFEHRDQAGILTNAAFDFKGNLLESTRVLTRDYQNDVDWNAPPPLQLEVFRTQTAYDALNRPIRVVTPSSNSATASKLSPTYNEAGLLETVAANVRGASPATAFVTNIDYNEKGQRSRIDYANGASTVYKYDPDTFRLIGLVTARNADPELFWDDKGKINLPAFAGDVLQYLTYTFDPVGNITYIKDDAQQVIFFNNRRVEPSADYTYDAVYWLVQSLGREHVGGHVTPGPFDDPRMGNAQPGDGNQLQTYTLQYDYDAAGNMLLMNNVGNWSMAFSYRATNNQLLTAVPGGAVGTPFTYPYDAHGNVTSMPHLTTMDSDFKDRLRHTAVSASGSISQESWYVYDADGQRIRKVVAKGNVTEERLYFGNIEIFRRSLGGTPKIERETLHINDDTRRIAMVDTPTVKPAGSKETQLTRYQYGNHLGSACLELDDAAQIISYEEYYPFGSTSYQGTDQSREVPVKRYRFTGKERDEDSGFYYFGARYYAPWIGRWTSCDPNGLGDGANLYAYTRNNPVRLVDPNGRQSQDDTDAGGTSDDDAYGRSTKPGPPSSFSLLDPPHLKLDPANFWYSSISQGSGRLPPGAIDVELGGTGVLGSTSGLGLHRGSIYGLQAGQLGIRKALGDSGFDIGVVAGGGYTGATSPTGSSGSATGAATLHYGWRPSELPKSFEFLKKLKLGDLRPALGGYSQVGATYLSTDGSVGATAAFTGVAALERDEAPTGFGLSALVLNPTFSYSREGQLSQGPTLTDLVTLGGTAGVQFAYGETFTLLVEGNISHEQGSPLAPSDQSASAWRYTAGVVGTESWLGHGDEAQSNSIAVGAWVFHESGSVGGTAAASSPTGRFETTGILFGVVFGYRAPARTER